MKNPQRTPTHRRVAALAFAFCLVLSQSAGLCPSEVAPKVNFAISTPASLPNATVGVAYSQALTVTTDVTDPSVNWAVSGTLPTGFTLAPTGTPATTLSSGPVTATPGTYQVTITARLTTNADMRAEKVFSLTVVSGASPLADAIAWSLTGPDATRSVGQQWTYSATVRDQFGTAFSGANITWVLSDPTVASVVSQTNGASPSVVVQALKPGTTTIRPTIAGVTSISPAGLTIVVGAAVSTPTTMTVFPVPVTATGPLTVGSTRQFAIEVRDQNNAVMAISSAVWSIVGTAGIASIDAGTGVATCIAAGTVTVRAIGPLNGQGVSLSATASLVCAAPPIASILVAPAHVSLATNTSQTYTAAAFTAAGVELTGTAIPTFTWATSNSAVASVNPSTGAVTAIGTGGALITATTASAPGVSGSGAVSVGAVGSILAPLVVAVGGAPIEGAILTATGGPTSGSGITNRSGRGFIPGLAPGTYTVTVSRTGFATQTFPGIVVTQNNSTSLQATITMVP